MPQRAAIALADLRVAQWPGSPAALPAIAREFVLDTCLRRLCIGLGPQPPFGERAPTDDRRGADAYQLLLEVTTGLLSAVPGETNVFGQFRRAWNEFRREQPARAAALEPLVTQAVRDTRSIRCTHLQNIGGASYGALVRRLLAPRQGERVLLVGAGDLARSMLPFFAACEVGTWNRSPVGAPFASAGRVFAPGEGALAAAWAQHVVMTTPVAAANDATWAQWLAGSKARAIVRLGHRRTDCVPSPAHIASHTLDDVFDLRHAQHELRTQQLERAREDCRARALALRAAASGSSRLAPAAGG